jgi:hypothetical protein
VLIAPFARYLIESGKTTRICGVTQTGQEKTISLVLSGGAPKPLMLADLACFIASSNDTWRQYASKKYDSFSEWIFTDIPMIVLDIKDRFRNGCAHSSSAMQAKAQAMIDYLEEKRVFEYLDEIAGRNSL